ncbi:hypothetical protein C0J50_1436 [Silurus asotus]|uniref:Myb/SANT-like DNA-binding domain-containing protein n=1 Tax=Silurus asotus TaxID=30991 RepID=A0AAD5A9G3_SILAS|nr:hypothetical protein C0J50_1436 [Silurus asotus]
MGQVGFLQILIISETTILPIPLRCLALGLFCLTKFCINSLGSLCHGISNHSKQFGINGVQIPEDDVEEDDAGEQEIEGAEGKTTTGDECTDFGVEVQGPVVQRKKDICVEITQNVNAMGSGQKRTLEQVKFRWKNLRARAAKDLAEAKYTQTGNRPFKKGEYTDVVLDIIGSENSKALHRIQGVVGDGEPTIVEESEPVPPNAEETFIPDLSPITEIQPAL